MGLGLMQRFGKFMIFSAVFFSLSVVFLMDASAAPFAYVLDYNLPPACLEPPSGMASWWSGDGHGFDLVGSNDGTLISGATYAEGIVGRAFSFSGAQDSYVEIANHSTLNPSGAFTIDGWFYIDPAILHDEKTDAVLAAKTNGDSGDGGWQLVFVSGRNGWTSALRFLVMGGGHYPSAILDHAITAADWYHVAAVYDPADPLPLKLYFNGALAASNSEAVTMANNSRNLRIGASHWSDAFGGNDRLNGKADEVEFFSRALSADEVAALYDAGSAGKCKPCFTPPSDMISWWTADGDANDVVGTNNGSLQNGATFAEGKVGQAFSFDGVNDYFFAAETQDIAGGAEATYIAWVYPGAVPAVDAYLGILGAGDSTLPVWTSQQCRVVYFRTGDSPEGSAKFYIDCGTDNTEPSYVTRYTSNDYPPGAWYLVAGVFDNGSLNIYVNGVLDNGAEGGMNPGATINTNAYKYVWLGALVRNDQSVAFTHFTGLVDEAAIFNHALSAEEIAAIYAAGTEGMCVPPDTTPDSFTFTDQTGVNLNTLIQSNIITVAGINTSASISISGGGYSIAGGEYTSTSGTVENGQTVRVRQTSSSSFSTTTNTALTIGSVSDTFSVTTLAADTTPDSFTFTDQTGVNLNTLIQSNIITVAGINTSASISISGGEYSIAGGDYTSTSGTIENGQTVRVRPTSSSSFSTTTNTTLTIGSVSDTFSVTTLARPEYTVTGSVPEGHGTLLCDSPVLLGDNSVCTITVDSGYLLKTLTDNGVDQMDSISANTYTIVNVTASHTVEGAFAKLLISPQEGTLGTVVQITGTGFGSKKGKVLIGTTSLVIAGWTGESIQGQLTKALPSGTYNVTVQPSGPKGTPLIIEESSFTVGTPQIDSVSPAAGSAVDQVTIQGKFFGGTKGKIYLEYEDNGTVKRKSCTVSSWTMDSSTGDSQVVFVVPTMLPKVCNIILDPSGTIPEVAKEAGFEVKAPAIDSLTPGSGSAGESITVSGRFFGTKKGKVYLGYEAKGKAARKTCTVGVWTDEEIVFAVPAGLPAGTYDVIVTNGVGSDTESSLVIP